jgi:hypothetical protein
MSPSFPTGACQGCGDKHFRQASPNYPSSMTLHHFHHHSIAGSSFAHYSYWSVDCGNNRIKRNQVQVRDFPHPMAFLRITSPIPTAVNPSCRVALSVSLPYSSSVLRVLWPRWYQGYYSPCFSCRSLCGNSYEMTSSVQRRVSHR